MNLRLPTRFAGALFARRLLPESVGQVVPDVLFGGLSAALLPGDVPLNERIGYGVENTLAQVGIGRLGAAGTETLLRLGGVGPARARGFGRYADFAGNLLGPQVAGSIGLQPSTHSIEERLRKQAEEQQRQMAEGYFQQGAQAAFTQMGGVVGASPPVQAADGLLGLLDYR